MARARYLVPAAFAAFAVGAAAIAIHRWQRDPLDDYRELRRRAEPEGRTPAAARGEVVRVHADRLFEIESNGPLSQRICVLSRSERDVGVGDLVAVQGTFYANGEGAFEARSRLEDNDEETCRDGVFVADTLTIYEGRMHG